eukprot:TRINITY_DN5592_c0_g1_i1.p2 TRINITY_DN5592_c0_g1~~TRINITY_DN5592_c0_g1_i1.p2  ORF type:complete len:314 (+),score=37.76 TRINITY_DN5592_c0_g1_i1:16-957(+)
MQILVITFQSLLLICVRQSKGDSIDFVKLIILMILAQYLLRFNISKIEEITMLDSKINNTPPSDKPTAILEEETKALTLQKEQILKECKMFEELNLDELVHELYTKIDPLYYCKDVNSLTKVKLEEVMLSSVSTGQELIHSSFCYNKYAHLHFQRMSTFPALIAAESQKLHQILKGKMTDPMHPFVIPENEINLIVPPRLINIVQIPLWYFPGQKLSISCVFKVRRHYQRQLRRSDLSSILTAQKYVRIFRNDENLKIFPFKEIDGDIQMFGNHLQLGLNFISPVIKEWLDKIEQLKVKKEDQAREEKKNSQN